MSDDHIPNTLDTFELDILPADTNEKQSQNLLNTSMLNTEILSQPMIPKALKENAMINEQQEQQQQEEATAIVEEPQEGQILKQKPREENNPQITMADVNRMLDEENKDLVEAPRSKEKREDTFENYNVTLGYTDITYGKKGSNKFYKIIILKKHGKFILRTQNGRIGALNPQTIDKEFDSRIDAIRRFKSKFFEKTQNDWDDRDDFVQKPNKYNLLSIEEGGGSSESVNNEVQMLNARNAEIKKRIAEIPSELEPRTYALMKLVWDIDRMSKTLTELHIDTSKNPLGRLKADQLQKGYRILTEIQNVLEMDGKKNKLFDLNNQFYSTIPHDTKWKAPPAIDNIHILKEKARLLDTLKELEVASRYINLSLFKKGGEEKNPVDSFFNLLNTRIDRVHETENIYSLISESLISTHGPTHNTYRLSVVDLFEIDRTGENTRFWPFQKLHNKKLLWHGSRVTNFVGILTDGLRIAPPEAPVTGYMFGKGVYFADVPSKSANYCHASKENPEGLLLLCEVALGNTAQVYRAKTFNRPPKYFHSVQGVGRNAPDQTGKMMFNDSVAFDLGKVGDNKDYDNPEPSKIGQDLIYNEYVVYDVGQVRIKYIVRVKFHYKDQMTS